MRSLKDHNLYSGLWIRMAQSAVSNDPLLYLVVKDLNKNDIDKKSVKDVVGKSMDFFIINLGWYY